MDKLFLTVLNMSLIGAFVIAAICIIRLPLKKAPKIISYCLWAVVGFRLVFPFSIESAYSLIPFKAQPIPQDIGMQATPRIDSGIDLIDNAINMSLPDINNAASINSLQVWQMIGSYIWFLGGIILLIYGIVSFLILKRKMDKSTHIEENIYEAKDIQSPFVLGIFNPKIYLPVSLSAQERNYIILHEQTHIRRHDHLIKFVAYFILCLHWFNPLAWVAFLLMGVDMEMSCDERVLKELGGEIKKDYSLSLLSLAMDRHVISGTPLAFSEGGLKMRIKNVLNFKKTSRIIIVMAVILVTALSVGFALNRAEPEVTVTPENTTGSDTTSEIEDIISDITNELVGNEVVTSKTTDELTEGETVTPKTTDELIESELTNTDTDILEQEFQLAGIWAEAMKTRDGKPRYLIMSKDMQKKFVEDQKQRVESGTDWNYNIGVSSPWVVDYSINVDGMIAEIVYLTTTSVPDVYYEDGETITFGFEDGKLVVIDSQIDFEGRPVK